MRNNPLRPRVEREKHFAFLAGLVTRYGSLRAQASDKRGTPEGITLRNEAKDQHVEILKELAALVQIRETLR